MAGHNKSQGVTYLTIDKEQLAKLTPFKTETGKEYYNLQVQHMQHPINKDGQNCYINSKPIDGISIKLGAGKSIRN